MPSILDSENDEVNEEQKDEANKSPISSASYGKKKLRNKPWRYLQRQRTTEEMAPLDIDKEKTLVVRQEPKVETPPTTCEESLNGFNGVRVSHYQTLQTFNRHYWIGKLKKKNKIDTIIK